jgi:hypothetical protein
MITHNSSLLLHFPRALTLCLVTASLGLGACSDDPSGGAPITDAGDTGLTDVVDDTADTQADVADEGSDQPDVPPPPPPLPVAVVVTVNATVGSPTPRPVYALNSRVVPVVTVYGDDGSVVEGYVPDFTVFPEVGATALGDGRWTLDVEGALTFTGCIEDDRLEAPLCADRTIRVDAGAPGLTITRPLPGEELLAAENPEIIVEGTVTDSSGEVRVFINGQKATVNADGTFVAELVPTYGVNHIDAIATNVFSTPTGTATAETRRGVDVMWAPVYDDYDALLGEAENIAIDVPAGLVLQLTQRFLDADLSVIGFPETGVVTTTDLAGLLELVFREANLLRFITNPVVNEAALQLEVLGIEPGQAQVDIIVTQRGLEIYIAINQLDVKTRGFAQVGDQTLSLNGGVFAAMSGYVRMVLRKEPGDTEVETRVELFGLGVEEMRGYFASPQANAILAVAESALSDVVENLAVSAVEDAFLNDLDDLLADAIGSVGEILTGQSFVLDLPFGGPLTITLDAELATLIPTRRQHLTASLDTRVGIDRVPAHRDSRGTALEAPRDEPPAFYADGRAQIGASMALVNGLLHALWNTGSLDLVDVATLSPTPLPLIQGAVLALRMPPHLRAASPEESEYDFLVTLGQVELTLTTPTGGDNVFGLYIETGASASIVDNRLLFDIQPAPDVTVWLISAEDTGPTFTNTDLVRQLVDIAWGEFGSTLTEGASIDLPVLDVSSIGDIAPSLRDLTVSIVLDRAVRIKESSIIIDGGIDGIVNLDD